MIQINEFIKILLILRQQINEIVRNNYHLSYQSEESLKKTINEINNSVDDEIPKLKILSRKLEFFFNNISTDTAEKIKNIIMIIWLIELELLYQPLKNLKGAGKVFCELFAKKNITTIIDLIEYLPYNYEIYRVSKISEIYADEYFIVSGIVKSIKIQYLKPQKKYITNILIEEESAELTCRFFGNPAIFKKTIKENELIQVSGKVIYRDYYQMINPKFKTVNFEKYKHGAIIVRPVYSLPERINYANFKKVLDTALNIYLPIMTDYLSSKIIKNKNFLKLTECLEFLHNPSDIQKISEYRRQMLFRNFYFFQFIIQSNRVTITKLKCAAFDYGKAADKIKKLINSLNFSLTKSQQKTFNEILNDISKDTPMRRLLQGDVGSGKTIIAILSTIVCVENNCQAVIMCPSELLAHQHYNTFLKFLEFANYRICLLTSAISKKTREILLEKISGGEIDIIIGTHSIIQKDVNFYKVGLVVIDEQHRFGVKQRLLAVKHSTNPHLLYMTATPIPRTLGLTIFSDFDISVISEKPRNRKKIITKIITEKEEEALFANIRKNAENGFQTFIVYPVIDESSKRELKSVKMRFEKLSNTVFKDINCAMLHSKINDEQRVNIMNDFASNKIKILFSTTIIEIGIDIPNANMMIIEHPECFGLAQLHQLRGRIGRNPIQSYCYLIISENLSTLSKQRIEKFTELDDGLALAEFDLQNRGCGDFIGERQSGLSENFIKDFFKHTDLMLEVKKIVFEILRNSDFKTKYLYLKKQMIFRK